MRQKIRRYLTALVAFSLIYSVSVNAQTKNEQIDHLLKRYMDLHEFEGTALVAKGGKIILEKAYGYENRETNTLNTLNTKFRIGSLTKQFTAMLIMQLKQEGRLSLTDPISRFLPYYRKDIGDRVTIHELLTHTSGIPDYTNRNNFFSEIAKGSYTPEDFVKKFCSDDLQSEPGTKYSYCNSEYYILGAIIESITKKTYAKVLQERIFDVLGMKNSGMENAEVLLKNRASGYNYNFGAFTNAEYINIASAIYAAGGIYSTVGDLFLWDNALYTNKLLSEENRVIMFTPFMEKYAYGITVNKAMIAGIKYELTFMVHTGAINGFRSVMLRETHDREVIILLSNVVLNYNYSIDLNPISNRIYSILNNLPVEMPKPSVVNIVGEKILSRSVDDAVAFFKQIKFSNKSNYDLTNEQQEFNSLGYYLLANGRVKDAIAIFKLNTEEFPDSWNAFDSYAESLMDDGYKELAIKNYKRSLELNPSNSNAIEQLKKLLN